MNKLLFATIFFSFFLTADCQTVDFTFESDNGSFCSGSTILFSQTCTGNPKSFIWDFGNNLYSDQPNATSSYANAGSYTVKLIAIFETVSLAITKVIVINPTTKASIGFDKNYLCQPGTINFTGPASVNGTNYEWMFGDGTPAVNTPSSTISHSFPNYGTDTVFLKTTTNSGCTDTASTIITITTLPMSIVASPVRGCTPASVNFTGNVTVPANSSVTSYAWNFGDGSPQYISSLNTASHTYTTAGDFFPALTATTSEGCSRTYTYNKVYFGTPPVNLVAYPQANLVCGSDSAVFIAKATNANRYYWTFGDGTDGSSSDTIIKHKYNTIGNKNVRVKPYYNECDAPSLLFQIKVIGVIAKFDFSNTCTNKNTYAFTDTSSGIPTSSLWNFGDGNQQADIINPVNSFPTSGQFKTTLSLQDTVSGCSDSMSSIVYTALPQLYSNDSAICINKTMSFSILNNYTDTSALYTWNLAGFQTDSAVNETITVVANNLGNFNNFVVIDYGRESCPDTVKANRSFLVKGPNLDFTVPANNCLNTPLIIINNSQPFVAGDSVISWSWNFGDSITNDVAIQPMPFQYATDGTYTVTLIAIDKNGCEDSLSKTTIINPNPFIHLNAAADSVCIGQSATMIAVHNNDLLWSPAINISCTTCDTTIATPLASATYYGTATNSFNCSSQDSIYIKVNSPFTASIVPADLYICQNENTTVDVNPKGKKVLWSPTAGLSDPTSYNPVITPTQNTTYTVTLTDTSGGCSNTDSASVNIHVKALPFVEAGPDQFYPTGTNYSFAPTYSNNIVSYLWTPSDLLTCNNCASPGGIATYNQQYVIKVISDSGCVFSDTITIDVDCKSAVIFMPKAFSPNNDNLNDVFYPRTKGIKSVLRFTVYNRQGRIIYEARNFSPNAKEFGWDGKFKGENQPMNTYVYTIETTCATGEKIFKKDSFLLLR